MSRVGNERTGNRMLVVQVAKSTRLTEGTMAAINEDGYAVQAEKKENLIAAGCVQHFCDNADGGDGDASALVKRGVFVWDNDGSIKNTDILKPCYFASETSVTITEDGSSFAGIILAVENDGVTVDMTARK